MEGDLRDFDIAGHDDRSAGAFTLGVLVETSPGIGALMPAERDGRTIVAQSGHAPILTGAVCPGDDLWRSLAAHGWKWSQDGAFSAKYWQHEAVVFGANAKRSRRTAE